MFYQAEPDVVEIEGEFPIEAEEEVATVDENINPNPPSPSHANPIANNDDVIVIDEIQAAPVEPAESNISVDIIEFPLEGTSKTPSSNKRTR